MSRKATTHHAVHGTGEEMTVILMALDYLETQTDRGTGPIVTRAKAPSIQARYLDRLSRVRERIACTLHPSKQSDVQ